MDFLVFLVLPDQQVKMIKITNPEIEKFFREERESFPKSGEGFLFDNNEISPSAQKAILAKGRRLKDLKAIHLFSLIALAGRRNRKDIFELTRRLQKKLSVSVCILLC